MADGSTGFGPAVLDVTVVLLDDGFSSTAVMPIEIFHSAGALWRILQGKAPEPRFRVTIASLDGAAVTSPYGLRLSPQASIGQIERTDVVIVPTPGLDLDERLVANSALTPWLQRQHAQGAYVAGVCMGAAHLAEAGLLDGRIATTHWALAEDFERRYPQVRWRPELMVTEDERVLCSGGVYASIDVSLYLVEKFCGHEVAVQVAKALLINMPRLDQTGYAVLPLSPPHADAKVREAETFLQQNYREGLTTDELAERAGLGVRTFVRRFKAATGKMPGAYLQAVRVELAKAMLERDKSTVQQVCSAVGYDDAAFFRALFKRSTGMTPADYRARFGALTVRGLDAGPVPVIS
jgi:transcriptional regulator GlxA family with amidase domain